jgi:hypothetical protein
LACRLIALNKNPGVRPIGTGITTRQIIAKAMTRQDIQEAADSLQLSAGQFLGIEATVHAADLLFKQEETKAIVLVDATNAFNWPLLHTICAGSVSHWLYSTHQLLQGPTELFP